MRVFKAESEPLNPLLCKRESLPLLSFRSAPPRDIFDNFLRRPPYIRDDFADDFLTTSAATYILYLYNVLEPHPLYSRSNLSTTLDGYFTKRNM